MRAAFIVAVGLLLAPGDREALRAPSPRPTVRPTAALATNASDLPRIRQDVDVRAEECAAPPPDLVVDLAEHDTGGFRLKVRRPGHLVAVRAGETISSARDVVDVTIEAPAREVRLSGDTTDPRNFEMARFELRWSSETRHLAVCALPGPNVTTTNRSRLHECRAFEDGPSDLAVVCRLAASARKVSTTNLSRPDAESAPVIPSKLASFVRFDLPLAEGRTEARLVGYLDHSTAVVVRAEATWARGEPKPSFILVETSRVQPEAPRRIDLEWLM